MRLIKSTLGATNEYWNDTIVHEKCAKRNGNGDAENRRFVDENARIVATLSAKPFCLPQCANVLDYRSAEKNRRLHRINFT
jgi:hypothetical protein